MRGFTASAAPCAGPLGAGEFEFSFIPGHYSPGGPDMSMVYLCKLACSLQEKSQVGGRAGGSVGTWRQGPGAGQSSNWPLHARAPMTPWLSFKSQIV
jgi:hypothetical protein